MQNVGKSARSLMKINEKHILSMLRKYVGHILRSKFLHKNPISYNWHNQEIKLASPRLDD